MITVVGLGVEQGDLTEKGKQAILDAAKNGKPIVARTAFTRSYENLRALGVEHTALDFVYEKSRSLSTLNKNLAAAVTSLGDGAVYCVDGSASEDNSVKILLKKRGQVAVIDGVSRVSAVARKANFKNCAYTAVSAYEIAGRVKNGSLSAPCIVYDLDDRALASDVKLALAGVFGDETQAVFVDGEKSKKIPLYELDRQKSYGYETAVAIEEQDLLDKKRFNADDLRVLVERLRAPGGCPWDRAQTPESIKMNVVEEAYELVDAVDCQDDDKILEETGDVLLQAVFYAVMLAEKGAFDLSDVATAVCEKLIFRHTHIFGKDKADTAAGALSVWEKNKMKEKRQETYAQSVNDVAKGFPAAMRAQKVGKRAAKAGLDFATVDDALARLQEEIAEFITAYQDGDKEKTEKELGDVLFSAVNVGRKAGCDCEKALKESTDRFARRFTLAEDLALKDGKTVTDLSEEEWDGYYLQAKKRLGK